MPTQEYEIRAFDLRAATANEYAHYNAFLNLMRAEILPEDPPVSCYEDTDRCRTMPDFIHEGDWGIWDRAGSRMIAFAACAAEYSGDNMHAAELFLQVLPEFRRQGLGRELLRRVVAYARDHQRRLLIAGSNERVPAGAAFLQRIGARKGLAAVENQLCLADVDRGLLARWMERGVELSKEFDLGLWDGPIPQERLDGMSALIQQLINDAPRDALELEDSTHVASTFSAFEAWTFAGGRRRWLFYAIHRRDDHLAGMTEVVWSPDRPQIIEQWGTGVWSDYRRRGLGRWLTAAMITKILREMPAARVIRTGNANSNAPMLHINNELGYKPFISRPAWQVETATVAKYLAGAV